MAKADQEKAALQVKCPQCGAQPGFSCRKARSLKDVRLVSLKHPHAARIQGAQTTEA